MKEQCSTCKHYIAIWNYGMFGCEKGGDYLTVNECNLYESIPSFTVTSTSVIVEVE